MDTLPVMRVEALSGQGQGHGMASPDLRRRRAHWLIDLVDALEDGHLDAARVQFAGLVHADPGLSHHPLLHRIGNALQGSQMKMAQQLARELRDDGLTVWHDLAHAQTHTPEATPRHADASAALPLSVRVHRASNGQHIVDYRA